MLYRFAQCTLDTQTQEFYRAGQRIPVQPRVLQVLTYLITQRHRLVPKQELLTACWPQPFVHASVVARCIMAARRAIGEQDAQAPSILMSRGQGYRFVLEVIEVSSHLSQAPRAVTPMAPVPRPPALSLTLPLPLADGLQVLERKWVSVLACLVTGPLVAEPAAALPASATLLQTLLTLSRADIRRYGGCVQTVSAQHGVLCFGAPLAQEDHAQRAVLSALSLRQCLQRVVAATAMLSAQGWAVQLGVHTGWITAGGGDDLWPPPSSPAR